MGPLNCPKHFKMSQSSSLDVAPLNEPRSAPELAETTARLHERTFNAAEAAAEAESPVRNRQLFFRGGVRVSSASPVSVTASCLLPTAPVVRLYACCLAGLH